MAQTVKNPPVNRHKFDPWVGKIPWRRTWQPIPVFLPGESHGQRSLVSYSLWVHRVRHNWGTNTFTCTLNRLQNRVNISFISTRKPKKVMWFALWWYSLYCGGLELNLQHLWDLPMFWYFWFPLRVLFNVLKNIFIYLVTSWLSCGRQDIWSSLWHE